MLSIVRSAIMSNGYLRKRALRRCTSDHVTIDGAQYCVHPQDNRTERFAFLYGQFPEPQSIARLSQLVARGPCRFIDIGANCGSYTVAMARAAARGSTIIAVGPNPMMQARLSNNLALNGLTDDVTVLGVVVSDTRGETALNLNDANFGHSSLLDNAAAGNSGDTISVPMTTLSDVLEETASDLPLIIKIDIEGLEDKAIWPILNADTPHLWPNALLIGVIHADQWQLDLLGRLEALGYTRSFEGEQNVLFERTTQGCMS